MIRWAGTDVIGRIDIVDQAVAALPVTDVVRILAQGERLVRGRHQLHAIGLAAHRFERARGGRAVGVGISVIAQGEVLRVVPQRGDGVAVVVAHDLALGTEGAHAARRRRAGVFREQVSLAAVISLLLGGVGVVLVGGGGLGAVETVGLGGIGAVGGVGEVGVVAQQIGADQIVDRRRARLGGERRFARRVGGRGIGGVVVVERHVFLIQHDHMLDRRGRSERAGRGVAGAGHGGRGRDRIGTAAAGGQRDDSHGNRRGQEGFAQHVELPEECERWIAWGLIAARASRNERDS